MQAPYLTPEQQAFQDQEHLNLLRIFYYVVGGITALCSSMGLVHFFLGLAMILNPRMLEGKAGSPPEQLPVGWMFMIMGAVVVLGGWVFGGLTAYCGKLISRRRGHTFVLVLAALNCLWVPLGTALGVFTFLVLMRP
jgi:hypothetical protein